MGSESEGNNDVSKYYNQIFYFMGGVGFDILTLSENQILYTI